jgi:hypothetical protein
MVSESQEMHRVGFRGLLFIYNWKRLKKSTPFWLSLIITLLSAAIIGMWFTKLLFASVQSLVALNLSVFPNLLGFTIGGYALIVGFTGVGDLKNFTERAKDEKGSFYQLLVSVFSISIFTQICTIVISYAISFIITSKFHDEIFGVKDYRWFAGVNLVVVCLLIFFSLWSFFTIPYLVVNLFNFAQTNHSIASVRRIEDEIDGETSEEKSLRLLQEIRDELRE